MGIIADIASGNIDTADLFFLLATILATLAAVVYFVGSRPTADGRATNVAVWGPVLLSLAVASASLAWLVL